MTAAEMLEQQMLVVLTPAALIWVTLAETLASSFL
jgi:hypothetical protein